MEQLLATLLSFPPHPPPAKPLSETEYDSQIQVILKQLNATPASQLVKPINGTDNILTIVDPSLNPLPYLFAILAQLAGIKKQASLAPGTPLWRAIEAFVESFDPVQVRYVGPQFRRLLDELLSAAERSNDAAVVSQSLELVQQAMLRLDPGTSTFISTHLDLVKICLQKQAYGACLRVLENDIYHFPADADQSRFLPPPCAKHVTSSTFITVPSGFSAKVSYRDHLQYFLFGAMVYTSQRDWARALVFLELVVCAPVQGNTVSMIQVEAYKKWILVHILCHGAPGTLSRTVTTHVAKYLASLAKPYTVIADAFKDESPARLRAEFKAGADNSIWQRDGNLSLVRLAVAAHRRTQVLRFSTIYSSISIKALSELMSSVGAGGQAEAPAIIEADIKHLIHSKAIHATISTGSDGGEVVKFSSTTGDAPVAEAQRAAELQRSVARVNALEIHVKDAQSRLELSKEYIEATKKRRKPAKEGVDLPSGVGDIQPITVMDEDIFAEY